MWVKGQQIVKHVKRGGRRGGQYQNERYTNQEATTATYMTEHECIRKEKTITINTTRNSRDKNNNSKNKRESEGGTGDSD